jgi:ectoine hydroxylase-related dioxygenase (phytanoyl-CoA dioxygenase family)
MSLSSESSTRSATTSRVEQEAGQTFDAHGPAAYAPELYDYAWLAEPVLGFDSVGDAAIDRYRTDGFLAIAAAFSPPEVAAALAGLTDLVDGNPPDFKGIQYERGARSRLAQMTPEQRQDAVRKLMWFVDVEPRLSALAWHPRLLALVARLLGDRPMLFQDMALLKPPRGREKPWHQDHAYFRYPLGTPIVGVWIALDEATPENGCMRLLAGSHRAGPVVHFQRRDWQICDTDIPARQAVAAPLQPGGLLLFDGLCQHGTPHNPTSERRRAVQFHYAPASAAKGSEEERLAVFGSEGKDVEC